MSRLERRVARLEQTNADLEPPQVRSLVRFVEPGQVDAPIQVLRDKAGHEWHCEPGETEEQFVERVWASTETTQLFGRTE